MNNVNHSDATEVPDVATEGENGVITQEVLDNAAFQVNVLF